MVKKKKKVLRKSRKPVRSKTSKAAKGRKVKAAKPKGRKGASQTAKRRAAKAKVAKAPELMLEKIGEVTHYFPHVNAAAVKLLKSGLKVGDKLYIKGHTTDFKEKVMSIQLDHVSINEGKKGQEIGLLVNSRVRIGDSIYKV